MSAATATPTSWVEDNRQHLIAALSEVYTSHAPGTDKPGTDKPGTDEPGTSASRRTPAPEWRHGRRPALESLVEIFRLTRFERTLLLLCAGVELETRFTGLCREWTGFEHMNFSAALANLRGAHWDALAPARALRWWRLIHVDSQAAAVTLKPIRICERILHYLAGTPCLEEQLDLRVQPVHAGAPSTPSLERGAEELAEHWTRLAGDALPPIQVTGTDALNRAAVASDIARRLGLRLLRLRAGDLPDEPVAAENLRRAMARESVLSDTAWLVEAGSSSAEPGRDAARLAPFVDCDAGPLILSCEDPIGPFLREPRRFETRGPTPVEQSALWAAALGSGRIGVREFIPRLVSHFNSTADTIESCARETEGLDGPELQRRLWGRCRALSRPRTNGLAQRIPARARLDELVLPGGPAGLLRHLVDRMRGRDRVYRSWGFGTGKTRGLGTSALFAGPSGTGKTMAAEAIASELQLDLFRVDVSAIMDKYIGETEKNLRRLFDAAEAGGVVLLFDEADALFGKRSDVRDSKDRFANLEVSYLLQRLETYQGLAILTTNLEDGIDTAFIRRIQVVVRFPFPSEQERARIWNHAIPTETPTESVDFQKLAKLDATGATIHNIALGGAFRAAAADSPLQMSHLLQSARAEMAKIGRPLTPSATKDWA